MDGGGIRAVQQRIDILPADEVGVEHDARRLHRGDCVQLSGGPERRGVDVVRHRVEQGVQPVIPEKIQSERSVVFRRAAVADHADAAVFAPPEERGERSREQLERLDRIRHAGSADRKGACPVHMEAAHQISSSP